MKFKNTLLIGISKAFINKKVMAYEPKNKNNPENFAQKLVNPINNVKLTFDDLSHLSVSISFGM